MVTWVLLWKISVQTSYIIGRYFNQEKGVFNHYYYCIWNSIKNIFICGSFFMILTSKCFLTNDPRIFFLEKCNVGLSKDKNALIMFKYNNNNNYNVMNTCNTIL